MKRLTTIIILLVLVTFTVSMFAVDPVKQTAKKPIVEKTKPMQKQVVKAVEKEYWGYLSDNQCGLAGKDPSHVDLKKLPGKHTVACMKSPACTASGFGIFIKNPKNVYEFHKFDAKGSTMAKAQILDKIKQKDNVKILTKGTMDKDGILAISSIKLMPPQAPAAVPKPMKK
ncbi:MAG TPA: hypothetical protein PLE74_12160 [Candidatus Cloacimonadota bacterium]|nr:hypothetical protein [Candidatus Cloacimonadota bacterium]HPT73020.1 hypothetical protein [Candidatus Cloacimonadota bacterium]